MDRSDDEWPQFALRPSARARRRPSPQSCAAAATFATPARASCSSWAPFMAENPDVLNDTTLWPTATTTRSETASRPSTLRFHPHGEGLVPELREGQRCHGHLRGTSTGGRSEIRALGHCVGDDLHPLTLISRRLCRGGGQ